MVALPPVALGWLAVGAPLTVVGYLVRARGWTAPLAGYEEASALPDEVVANVVGMAALRIGLMAVGVGAFVALADAPRYLTPIVAAAIVLSAGQTARRLRKSSRSG